jgi:hypothetical protein
MFVHCLSSIPLGEQRGGKFKNFSGHVQFCMGRHVIVLFLLDVQSLVALGIESNLGSDGVRMGYEALQQPGTHYYSAF